MAGDASLDAAELLQWAEWRTMRATALVVKVIRLTFEHVTNATHTQQEDWS